MTPTARRQVFDTPTQKMKALLYILDRLAENSTWRGIILVATAIGLKVEPDHQEAIVAAGLGLVGAINVFRKGK